MRRLSKDAVRGAVALLTVAVFASVLSIGARTRNAEAGGFSITSITANCNGAGLVYFTGTLPEGGFTLELMDKAPDNSGSFVPTSPPTVTAITSGDSPVAYAMPLGNWSPPHYRVDSNFETKSPSLFCEGAATNTPQATATGTVTPAASATRTPTATETASGGSTRTSTPTAVPTTTTPARTSSASAASPPAAAVNTVLALARPPDVARLPVALPNTGDAGVGAGGTRATVPRALGILALGLLVAGSGSCYRRARGWRDR